MQVERVRLAWLPSQLERRSLGRCCLLAREPSSRR
jgi:hypothetical protein